PMPASLAVTRRMRRSTVCSSGRFPSNRGLGKFQTPRVRAAFFLKPPKRVAWRCAGSASAGPDVGPKDHLQRVVRRPLLRLRTDSGNQASNSRGSTMKCASVVKAAAAVAAVVGMAGCTDLKPLQAQVDDLKAQVAKLGGDLSAAKSASDQ